MKLGLDEVSLANYPAAAPAGSGVQATLTSHRLVWLQGTQEEHYPLNKTSCVSYGFERAHRSVTWAVIMLVIAVMLAAFLGWAQTNLPALAESMVKTLADHESPQRIEAARRAYAQRVDTLSMAILPLWGLAGALFMYATWLLYSGIRGMTRVVFTSMAVSRVLQQRGRDSQLLEFGELLAQRACGLEPRAEAEPEVDTELLDWIPNKKKTQLS